MTDKAAGLRLKKAIHVARARANILYDTDLAVRAGVSYDTLMNWYGGKTVPRGAELRRVGHTLGVQYADLMAAFEGKEPEPPELTAVLRDQVAAINDLVEELRLQRAEQAGAMEGIARALGVAASIREGGGSIPSSGPPSRGGPGPVRAGNGGQSRP